MHPVARHEHALLARVVVHEADHGARQLGVAAQLEGHLLAAVAGADDQHLVAGPLYERASQRALDGGAHEEACAAHQRQREQEVERDHPARRVVGAQRQEEQPGDEHEARDHHGLDDRLEVRLVHEAPQLRVEPEGGEQRELGPHHERHRVDHQVLVPMRDPGVEAQDEGQVVGERNQACVDSHLPEAACTHRGCNPGLHFCRAESSSFTNSRGSRRIREESCSGRFSILISSGSSSLRSRPSRSSASSTAPSRPLEGGEHGRPERHRLAVHGTAGGDHEVGEGDQALGIHGAIGDREPSEGLDLGRCVGVRGARRPARRAPSRARAGRAGSRSGGRARPPAGCAPPRSAPGGRGPARRAPRRRARSRPGSTPP